MKFWEKTSGLYKREIYYYDTRPEFESEKFAGRLLLLMMEEMKARGNRRSFFYASGQTVPQATALGR